MLILGWSNISNKSNKSNKRKKDTRFFPIYKFNYYTYSYYILYMVPVFLSKTGVRFVRFVRRWFWDAFFNCGLSFRLTICQTILRDSYKVHQSFQGLR